ncbi:hypothetical protein ASG35_09000 [Burkholderia sp. Leaf177]|nr:hypothetical protein ASG35_09000 [Burkholderia sp. Leaf177]
MRDTYQNGDAYRSNRARVTGQQAYHLDVPSASNSKDISVISYHAREGMASPYEITIEFTQRVEFQRHFGDFVSRARGHGIALRNHD